MRVVEDDREVVVVDNMPLDDSVKIASIKSVFGDVDTGVEVVPFTPTTVLVSTFSFVNVSRLTVESATVCVIRLLVFVINSTSLKSVLAFSPLNVYASVVIGPEAPARPVALQPMDVVPLRVQSTVNLLRVTGHVRMLRGVL